jgi:hypothetical protein
MSLICFEAILARPVEGGDWLFLRLPQPASDQLPARSMCSVEGTMQGQPVATTLLPDGEGGHWMKVDPDLIASLGLAKGQTVSLKIAPVKVEPEPKVPAEIAAALSDASPPRPGDLGEHHADGPSRLDFLDRLRQEGGDAGQATRGRTL